MKTLKINITSIVLTSLLVLAACSSDDDDDVNVNINDNINDNNSNSDNGNVSSAFDFQAASVDTYTRVDRMGMPAIATALISSRDAYNDANPADDAAGTFVPEILASLQSLHGALDGQLTGLGLTPCTVVGDGTGTCAQFAVPLILPDTLKIDTAAAAGFPNGRQLSDPVIDVTLAVALLELTGEPAPHAPDALVGVLNPAQNDRTFNDAFPFLATPH